MGQTLLIVKLNMNRINVVSTQKTRKILPLEVRRTIRSNINKWCATIGTYHICTSKLCDAICAYHMYI